MAAPKLRKNEKEQLISWIGEFYMPAEIVSLVEQHFDKKVTVDAVGYYQRKNEKKIEKLRRTFLENLKAIPEANKTVRVDRLGKTARRLLRLLDIPKAERTDGFLDLIKEYRTTLRQIAEETDGILQRSEVEHSGHIEIVVEKALKNI